MQSKSTSIRRAGQLAGLVLIASFGLMSSLRAQVLEPPFDPRLLFQIPNQTPGSVQIIPLADLPPQLREGFSLEAKQRREGLAERGTAQYFVSNAEPYALALFNRLDSSMISDRSALPGAFNGRVADIPSTADTQGMVWKGFAKEGPLTNEQSKRIYQVFASPSGEMYALLQWNFVAAGASILAAKENMNATINGQPGVMVVQVDGAGQSMWNLAWHAGEYWFELFASGLPVSPQSAAKILRIASSVR